MRYLLLPLFLLPSLFSGCAHTTAGQCTPGPGCEIPDYEFGTFDSEPRGGLAFGYSCYETLPQDDTAVCHSSYGLTPEEIEIGKRNCGGVVLNHRCPTNPLLYCSGLHSRGDPARPMVTYLYFGNPFNSQVLSKSDLLGGDTEFNPGFVGRLR
jgi:hypothetical protein